MTDEYYEFFKGVRGMKLAPTRLETALIVAIEFYKNSWKTSSSENLRGIYAKDVMFYSHMLRTLRRHSFG